MWQNLYDIVWSLWGEQGWRVAPANLNEGMPARPNDFSYVLPIWEMKAFNFAVAIDRNHEHTLLYS